MLPQINRFALACFLLALPVHSFAQQYALLVGISAYSAKDIPKLRGPMNDVVLGKEVLKGAGFSEKNIRVLADGVAISNGEPTRQGILGELDTLAKKVQRGDFVYLQLGGHGSQQLSRSGKMPREPDGLDEIFLPVDAGSWDEVAGIKHNVIRDDEMGVAINAIRAKGAFVWAVFDACHSGNITRGGEEGVTERRLEIPQSILARARADAVQQTKGGDVPATRGGDAPAELALGSAADNLEGGYVYFYAAQTTEPTQERLMPSGNPNRKAYGVFTYTLAQVVQNNPGISYRQAGERVLQIYAANRWGATPMFEGSGLDAPVFMQKAGDVLWQWQVASTSEGFEIKAGSLQQFETGAIFGLFSDAAAKKDAAPLGYFKADKVEVLGSHLVPIKYNDKPALENIPTDAVVRLVDSNINLNLRVALPPTVPKGKEYELAQQVIDKLRKEGSEGIKVEWVNANQSAQVRLMLSDERGTMNGEPNGKAQLWLLPTDGTWIKEGPSKTPAIVLNKTESKLSSVLADYLQSIAKATNLYRLSTMGDKGVTGGGKIETHFFVTKAKTGKRVEMHGGSVPEIEKGDALEISITSNNLKPVDVTVLGIDANYGIGLLYPFTSKEANRVQPNETITIPSAGQPPLKLDGKTQGRESVLVIAVEAEPNSPTVNLGFLQQQTLGTREVTRGNVSVRSLFESAGFGNDKNAGTRGFGRDVDAEKTSITVYQYKAKGG